MKLWLLYALIAQFLNATVVLLDKYLVTARIKKPLTYTFYVSILSITALFVLPFVEVNIPSPATVWYSLGFAATFICGLICLYSALRHSSASEVVPMVGGAAALATLVFALLLIGEELPPYFLGGSAFLIGGMVTLSHFRFSLTTLVYLVGGGAFFGFSGVLLKIVFTREAFWDAFFWTRMALVIVALMLFLIPIERVRVKTGLGRAKRGTFLLIIANKMLAGAAAFLTFLAIREASVSLVSALVGLQFAFLLLFAFLFTRKFPEYFHDTFHKREILHRISSVTLIVVGFILLALP